MKGVRSRIWWPYRSKYLDAIRKLGIKIAIVEFGLGYSSIDTLCKVDFDFVVIDKKFTKNLLS
ncbi:MAG: EAL domain-containing protein, partial [Bacteroidaceae bacterium]|nr:EAL domain-containing protein [Bacteroidaceae bacterium]